MATKISSRTEADHAPAPGPERGSIDMFRNAPKLYRSEFRSEFRLDVVRQSCVRPDRSEQRPAPAAEVAVGGHSAGHSRVAVGQRRMSRRMRATAQDPNKAKPAIPAPTAGLPRARRRRPPCVRPPARHHSHPLPLYPPSPPDPHQTPLSPPPNHSNPTPPLP